MKKYLLITISLFWILAACSSAVTPVPDIPTETLPAQTSATPTIKYYLLDTVTGNAELDVILAAVATGNPGDLIKLFGYTRTACKTVNALGGPPPCREGEAEGTTVDVLPFLGPEGSYWRKDEIDSFSGMNVIGVYAVYRVSDTAYSEEYFPAGNYGIMFIAQDNLPGVVLQIKNGQIIRIDYVFVFDPSAFDTILQRDASTFVLSPNSK